MRTMLSPCTVDSADLSFPPLGAATSKDATDVSATRRSADECTGIASLSSDWACEGAAATRASPSKRVCKEVFTNTDGGFLIFVREITKIQSIMQTLNSSPPQALFGPLNPIPLKVRYLRQNA